MISIFVLNNPFPTTSGAKFVYTCGSPSHKPFRVVGMAQARHLTGQDRPPTRHDICQTSDATCQATRRENKAISSDLPSLGRIAKVRLLPVLAPKKAGYTTLHRQGDLYSYSGSQCTPHSQLKIMEAQEPVCSLCNIPMRLESAFRTIGCADLDESPFFLCTCK